ncbi:hypothetical protein QTO34_012053 [Cnephaeus nilssonii]|uniref:Uncharacterized protein n=1 Tax=Cnephaeus nilssonii TaxID=3371016 RepID=A0AA40HC01_CNENI|nr:hypothetical protein QTO34_012053 [Eptesicus nilssonii]
MEMCSQVNVVCMPANTTIPSAAQAWMPLRTFLIHWMKSKYQHEQEFGRSHLDDLEGFKTSGEEVAAVQDPLGDVRLGMGLSQQSDIPLAVWGSRIPGHLTPYYLPAAEEGEAPTTTAVLASREPGFWLSGTPLGQGLAPGCGLGSAAPQPPCYGSQELTPWSFPAIRAGSPLVPKAGKAFAPGFPSLGLSRTQRPCNGFLVGMVGGRGLGVAKVRHFGQAVLRACPSVALNIGPHVFCPRYITNGNLQREGLWPERLHCWKPGDREVPLTSLFPHGMGSDLAVTSADPAPTTITGGLITSHYFTSQHKFEEKSIKNFKMVTAECEANLSRACECPGFLAKERA